MAHLYYLTIYRSQTFAGRFPPPFDKMAKKGIRAYSRYNTQRTPTNLHAPTMKALLGYCRALLDEGASAIGSDGGDTLFAGSCGRTDFPTGDPKAMRASLQRLAALVGDYTVLPGHGSATTLHWERAHNPFMQE